MALINASQDTDSDVILLRFQTMNKDWSDDAWADHEYWQTQDKRTLSKINELLKDIERNGVADGIGKPEFLKYKKAWSRMLMTPTD